MYIHVLTHSFEFPIMKRDHFSLVLRFLHLNDSSQYRKKGEPGHDPLFKLRPFINPHFHKFQQHYTLSKEVCIDEGMIAFKLHPIYAQKTHQVGDEGIYTS